jgi:DNA-binding response OmpR family regulator
MGGVVLLIDDEVDMKDLVSQWLDQFGVEVIQATRFEDAAAAAAEQRPRAVLLDISLGAEDGLVLLPRLMALPALSEVPVVVFSVHASRRWEALELGAVGFVPKPFEGHDLLGALSPYLG